jgi:hypothetical protein
MTLNVHNIKNNKNKRIIYISENKTVEIDRGMQT